MKNEQALQQLRHYASHDLWCTRYMLDLLEAENTAALKEQLEEQLELAREAVNWAEHSNG